MRTRQEFVRGLVVGLLCFAAAAALIRWIPYSIVLNRTASIPLGIYLSERARAPLAAGALACFRYQAPDWARPRMYFPDSFELCKMVLGQGGDHVERHGGVWHVRAKDGSMRRVGPTQLNDSAGRPLPQSALTEGPIPRGLLLMAAPAYSNSLDSRYLGLVRESEITRRIHPVITW